MSEPDRTLYLAIPIDIFKSFFQEQFTQEPVRQYQVKLIAYDPLQKVIIEWKE